MKKWLVVFISVFSLSSFVTYGQLRKAQRLELDCVHLYPIQMKYFERHVNFSKATKNLEARTIEQLIERLDGSKLYFLKSDVTKIQNKIMPGIFAKLKQKQCQPIEEVEKLFVKRVEERVNHAKKFLGKNFKFNKNAKIYRDPEDRPRAKTASEANRFHENYMNYQVASYLATDMKLEEAKQQIVRNYERALRRIKEQKKEDLWALYVDSFARALDPHSSYLSADALEDFEIQMRLSLEGIGATLSSQDGFTVIEQLVSGGAAEKSGKLKPKDKIIGVAQGKEPNFQNVIEMDLRDVVRLIRGPKGSSVTLQILRKKSEGAERFTVTLVRDRIKLEDEAAAVSYLEREIENPNKKGEKIKKKVALLNLPSFYSDNRKNGRSAASDINRLIEDIKKEKADALVLDMSTNGGGSLRDAVDIAGFFFRTGNVVKQSQRVPAGSTAEYEVLRDTNSKVNWEGPLVVLVSRVSASASEIVSGTLQDYKRAVIVGGDHTFGKGSVQSVEYLPAGLGAIKTTVGMFFTPGGNSTQHRGVTSDIIFPSALSIDEIGEKTLDYSLPPKSIPPFISKSAFVVTGEEEWEQVDKAMIARLAARSKPRVAASEAFEKVKKEIAKNAKRKETITAGELLKDKEEKDKVAKGVDPSTDTPEEEEDPEEELANLSKEERQKKYLERGDVQEAVNIAADLSLFMTQSELRLGAKNKESRSRAAETN